MEQGSTQHLLSEEERRQVERDLLTWAHARVDMECLIQQRSEGSDLALTLINRILMGEVPSQLLKGVLDQDLPSLLQAFDTATKARNAHFHYPPPLIQDPLPYPEDSLADQRALVGGLLEIWWFVFRCTRRLMSASIPGARHARQLVYHISLLGETHTEVVNRLDRRNLQSVQVVLHWAQTDPPITSGPSTDHRVTPSY